MCVCISFQCPIDTRKVLSENLVVIGGTAMLPGFLHRVLAEIRLLVERPKYSDVLASKSFRIHAPPAKPNCTAWLGGQTWGFIYCHLFKRKLCHFLTNIVLWVVNANASLPSMLRASRVIRLETTHFCNGAFKDGKMCVPCNTLNITLFRRDLNSESNWCSSLHKILKTHNSWWIIMNANFSHWAPV